MRRSFVTLVAVMIFVSAASGQDSLQGTWTAHSAGSDGFWISLSVNDYDWHGSKVLWLPKLPEDTFKLDIDREPGHLRLDGTRRGAEAAGFFTFRPRLEFNEEIAQLGYEPFDFNELYFLTAIDARISEIRRLSDLGYSQLSNDELFAMHIHGALADHIIQLRRLGFENLSVDDLIATRIHEVTPEFIEEIRTLGFEGRSIDELITMRIHEVTPEYVKSIRALGYEDVTVEELISMRIHDVTPGFIRAVNEKLDLDRP